MTAHFDSIAVWLADFHVLATALLAAVLAALAIVRQPAQRMAIAKAALGALAAIALLTALPGWSVVHLMAPEVAPRVAAAQAGPISPAAQGSLQFQPMDAAPAPPTDRAQRVFTPQPMVTVEPAAAPREINWPLTLAAVHAMGSLGVLLWLTGGAIIAQGIVRRARRAPVGACELLAQLAVDGRTRELLVSSEVATPVAVGMAGPRILLPPGSDDSNLSAILAHELAHIQNGDLRTLAASRMLLVLLWPQPLYWWLRRVIRLDQEMLADAAASDLSGRVDYAEQLLGWARHMPQAPATAAPRLAGAVGLWESPSQLKRRVAILLNEKFAVMRSCSRRWRGACFVAMATAALALSLVTLQPATQAADEEPPGTSKEAKDEQPKATVHAGLDLATFSSVQLDPAWGPVQYQKNGLKMNAVDEAGKPVNDAEVLVYRASLRKRTHELLHTARTDEHGAATFDDLLPAEVVAAYEKFAAAKEYPFSMDHAFLIAVRRPGLSTMLVAQDGYALAMRGCERTLLMRPAAELRGRVTDPQGRPVAGATVAVGRFSGGLAIEGVNATKTDAEGRYVFADRAAFDAEAAQKQQQTQFLSYTVFDASVDPPGDPNKPEDPAADLNASNLMVTHPEYAATRVAGGDIPGTTDVRMLPAAEITGRVVRHGSGEPAGGVAVTATGHIADSSKSDEIIRFPVSDFHQAMTKTDADGRYRLSNLPPGSYSVSADPGTQLMEEAPWVSRGHGQIKVEPGEPATAPDLIIGPGGTIRVQLVDAKTGEPLRLEAPAMAQPFMILVDGPSMQPVPTQRVPVSAEGVFEMRSLPGEVRSGAFVYRGKLPVEGSTLYQSDDDVHATGEVLEAGHGETIEAKFPVWPIAELERWREQTQAAQQLLADGKYAEAVEAFTALVEERPEDYSVHLSRAVALRGAGNYREAIAGFEKTLALYPEDLNARMMLADLLATAPEVEVRNGLRAVKLAEELIAAAARIEHGNQDYLAGAYGRLAAAHAEVGAFDKAVAAQQEAIKLAPEERRGELEKRLELYQSGKPFRKPAAGGGDKRSAVDREHNVTVTMHPAPGGDGAAAESPNGDEDAYVPTGLSLRYDGDGTPPEEPGDPTQVGQTGLLKGIEQNFPARSETELPEPSTAVWSAKSPVGNEAPSLGGESPVADNSRPATDPLTASLGFRSRNDAEPNVFKGRAADESGRPIAGVNVSMLRGSHDLTREAAVVRRATTGADGVFRFENVVDVRQEFPDGNIPASDSYGSPLYRVVARKAGRASRESGAEQVYLLRNGIAIDYVMAPGATLRGRITDPQGKPVAGALVSKSASLTRSGAWTARTDANGEYEISDLAEFQLAEEQARLVQQQNNTAAQLAAGADAVLSVSMAPRFTVSHRSFATASLPATDIPGRADAVLKPAATIVGRVVDDEGKPVAKALVMAYSSPDPRAAADIGSDEFWSQVFETSVRADEDGRFIIPSLFAGSYDVWAEAPGLLCRGQSRLLVTGGEQQAIADLVLTKGVALRVQFIDAATGTPPTGSKNLTADIAVVPQERIGTRRPSPPQPSRLDEAGVAVLQALPGKNIVGVSRISGGGNAAWRPEVKGAKAIDVSENPPAEVVVRVVSGDAGAP